MAMIGSGMYEQAFDTIDTQIVNVLARRICGVASTARIPVLLADAGALSARNLYQQHCAAMVDLALRAENSCIQNRLSHKLETEYQVESWDTRFEAYAQETSQSPRLIQHRFWGKDIKKEWYFRVLGSRPIAPWRHVIPSVYRTYTKEAAQDPKLKEGTCALHETSSWWTVGAQVLHTSG